MQTRRNFLKVTGTTSAVVVFGVLPIDLLGKDKTKKLTILHTNDTHSRLEPFPADHPKLAGKAGMAKRAKLVEDIRKVEKDVLLLDAGDVSQGTPYFNFYKGELNYKLMSMLKYDASTLGNHEFDNGLDGIKNSLKFATFPLLNCNYNFKGTVLEGVIKPYKIFNKSGIKIGIFGVGVELDGLVDPKNYEGAEYQNPIIKANEIANILKEKEKCNVVILLSHLGYKFKDNRVSDVVLAAETSNIDLIIGGHTHTFMDKPDVMKNKSAKDVTITQAGYGGIKLGRIDLYFNENKKTAAIDFNLIDVV
ncbi:MAG: metallophosphatase [Ichthyobacteriaceae bacterium]|nr:metallophosphatase [Ichthyobacteriaceae bacterium]